MGMGMGTKCSYARVNRWEMGTTTGLLPSEDRTGGRTWPSEKGVTTWIGNGIRPKKVEEMTKHQPKWDLQMREEDQEPQDQGWGGGVTKANGKRGRDGRYQQRVINHRHQAA